MASQGPHVDVRGADTVAATLGLAGDRLAALAPSAAGALVRDRSRARAPFVTGRLRASLSATQASGRVTVGSPLPYAHVIHNGWAAHGIRANPYLIPTAEELSPIWGAYYVTDAARVVSSTVRGA